MTSRHPYTSAARAFTLNEMLIVIAIIVLMLGLAVPAFNVLTGSKSTEGASNQISAVLAQARSEAIGLQETRGVLFFLDPATDRINLAMVRDSGFLNSAAGLTDVTYLDLVADRDFVALPAGVMLQTVNNANVSNLGVRANDGYIGFNAPPAPYVVQYGGVILFDAFGKLICTRYGFRCCSVDGATTGPDTRMGALFHDGNLSSVGGNTCTDFSANTASNNVYSQFGFIAFSKDAFINAGYTKTDPQIASPGVAGAYTAGSPSELTEEVWLDSNAQVFLVNRYNGTLVKGD